MILEDTSIIQPLWISNLATLDLPVCLDSVDMLTIGLFNPSDNNIKFTLDIGARSYDLNLLPGWGDYVIEIGETICQEKQNSILTFHTDFILSDTTDNRQLSIAVDYITITSE